MVTKGEDPIGKPLNLFDKDLNKDYADTDNLPVSTIAGIVDNLYTNTLEQEVNPFTIQINNSPDNAFNYIYIRLNGNQEKALATVREVWNKVNPGQYFTYRDVYRTFLQRNEKQPNSPGYC